MVAAAAVGDLVGVVADRRELLRARQVARRGQAAGGDALDRPREDDSSDVVGIALGLPWSGWACQVP